MAKAREKDIEKLKDAMFDLGEWTGRHQAFGMIANRCSAADAECLKIIRDNESYKELGMNWDQFCSKHLGASRTFVEKQIHCWEEFGANYHRFTEALPLSPATYRLLQGSVTDEGLKHNGEVIPLTRENRTRLSAAVNEVRASAKAKPGGSAMSGIRKCLDTLVDEVVGVSTVPESRLELIAFLDRGSAQLQQLAKALRQNTVIVE